MTVSGALFRPATWSWYALLILWMQGMAFLNFSLALCFLLSWRLLPDAIARLSKTPIVWKAILAWEILRVISSTVALHPSIAFTGMLDDLRGIAFGLLALAHLRSRQDLITAAKLTSAGLLILSTWVIAFKVYPHMWQAALFESGTLSEVNAAAVYTSIAIIVIIGAFAILPLRQTWPLMLLLAALVMLQIPYSSRSTLLFSIVVLFLMVFLLGQRRAILIASLLAMVVGSGLLATNVATNALRSVSQVVEERSLKASGSLQIRWEIFRLLAHLSLKRPLGLGPRNHGYVDLNAEREYLRKNFAYTARHLYGLNPSSKLFDTFDFNHPHGPGSAPVTVDPHSQYAATLAETGPLGLIALALIYFMIARLSWPLLRNPTDPAMKLLGLTGLSTCLMFLLCGVNVALFSKAGTIIIFGVSAALARFSSEEQNKGLTELPSAG